LINLVFASIVLASIYALVAFAWVLLFKTNGILNVAIGAQIVVGAFLFNQFLTVWRLSWPLGILCTILALLAAAAVTHLGVFSRLAGHPEFVLVIAALGLESMIKGGVSLTWGPEARVMRQPVENKAVSLPEGIHTTTYGLIAIGLCVCVFIAAVAFFRFSRSGIQMRAAAENPVLAAIGGIRVDRVYVLGWFIAFVVAALAGILYSYLNVLSFSGPASLGLRGAAPALVGGLDSIIGVVPGALIVGAAETFGVYFFGGKMQDVAAWIVILVVLVVRPQGLFGSRHIERV
jgi:branched-chain amino acid transport system permease protein